MNLEGKNSRKIILPIVIIVSSLALYLTSFYSYLLFHLLVELFTVVIALGIFVVAWSSRHYIDNVFLLTLGIGYFFIGSIDLLHTLSYSGMQIFHNHDSNLPTQLWIIGRYMEAFTFIGALIFLSKNTLKNRNFVLGKANFIFLFYAVVSAVLLLAVFYWKIFPEAYVEGVGLTPFKKNSEYIISGLMLFSIVLLFKKSKLFDSSMVNLLSLALMLKVAAELSFTGYIGVYDFSNMLGHLLKFISFLLLYKAILEIGLMNPYQLLFIDFKKSQEEYSRAQSKIQRRIESDLLEAYKHMGIFNRKLSLLLEIEEYSARHKNKQEVIRHIMKSVKGACHASVALLYKCEKNHDFSLVLGEGIEMKAGADMIKLSPQKATFVKKLVEEKKRISFPCEAMLANGLDSQMTLEHCVAVPLMQENECGGFLLVGFEKYEDVDKQGLEFLDILSIHIAAAINRLRLVKDKM